MEQLTIFDFEKLYGKEHIPIAKAFWLDEQPITQPFRYKKMIEVLLYHHAGKYGQNAYLEALRTYNNDVYERFKETIHLLVFMTKESLGAIQAFSIGLPFSLEGFCIKDEYTTLFKDTEFGKVFRYERDLEKILTELISDFAWCYSLEGESFEVKNQAKMTNGTIDILISNENSAIVFELKKGTAKRADVFQVLDYSKSQELKGKRIERVLVAKRFEDDVLGLANDLSVSCISYSIGYNYSDPYFLFLVSRENHVEDNEIFSRYIDDGYEWGDVFDDQVVLGEFIHPYFNGSLKDFYISKIDELEREITAINTLTNKILVSAEGGNSCANGPSEN
ncbi:hypothetical protein [Geobacillus kaustophilus]|uniref:hypothetical protein n=1 Tax=Geobacillus kaustophilus TaxID=1462 RepID=UPI0005CCD252|nr:hypothetical protein [Geobacillus kaustophilus]